MQRKRRIRAVIGGIISAQPQTPDLIRVNAAALFVPEKSGMQKDCPWD